MKRINVYTENEELGEDANFEGWFDSDVAEQIASYVDGDLYKNGKILLATKNGKLVVNTWNNQGYDRYRFADDEKEIAEILSAGGYGGDESDDDKLKDILGKFEI